MLSRFLLFCILIFSTPLFGQYEKDIFTAPLEIPLFLSGNFAELRTNHFHTGIDIKTQGVTGQKVLAAAEGKVSRISVSPWGYGNALYIDHPNGYTTVYGHLERFIPEIEKVVRAEQYAQKSFSVDFTPSQAIEVERGEVVAFSGNSGGSGGPHLHFEIRNTNDSHPLNPLKFGFDIKDNIAPRIRGIRFHPLSDTTLINGKNEAQSFVVNGSDGNYHLKPGTNINVFGAFGVSVHTLDFLNGHPNKCGVYSIFLQIDNDSILYQRFDELDFATTRHINCYKDYEVYHANRWHYHKSFIEPGNKLEIYFPKPEKLGVLHYPEKSNKKGLYTIMDAYGNTSLLSFEFSTLSAPNATLPAPAPYDAYFSHTRENTFMYEDELLVYLPEGALYRDLEFQFSRQLPKAGLLSPLYQIHYDRVPLQEKLKISISLENIPDQQKTRIVGVRYDTEGRATYHSGKIENGFFVFNSKEFGQFALTLDTSAPDIKPLTSAGGNISKSTSLKFRISDDRTGVATFDAYLNGEWILAEFDGKNALLEIKPGDRIQSNGDQQVKIVLVDGAGNKTEKIYNYKI